MGAGASAKAEAISDIVRPARYVAHADPDADASDRAAPAPRESRESQESREARELRERKDAPDVRDTPARVSAGHGTGHGTGHKQPAGKTNRLRETRIEKMMSKAELARRANLSVLTIDRVEKGLGCRMDTKRKILEALGLSLADRVRVFGEEE